MKKQVIILLISLGFITGACNVQSKEHYYINANGTGKVTINTTMANTDFKKKEETTPNEKAKKVVNKILNHSKGVETWKNVSFKAIDKGKQVSIQGTVYFKDLNKLKIKNITYFPISFKKGTNSMTLALSPPEKKKAPGKKEKLEKHIAESIKNWDQMKAMFEGPMTKSRFEMTFHVPTGKTEVSNLEKKESKTGNILYLLIDGPEIFKAYDATMRDEKSLEKAYLTGSSSPQNTVFMSKLIGNDKPVQATITGKLNSMFDYDKEVKAAKSAYPAMIKKLGLDKKPDTKLKKK